MGQEVLVHTAILDIIQNREELLARCDRACERLFTVRDEQMLVFC
jgi:hypothetical protein